LRRLKKPNAPARNGGAFLRFGRGGAWRLSSGAFWSIICGPLFLRPKPYGESTMPQRRAFALCLIILLLPAPFWAQAAMDNVTSAIRAEGVDNSQIMKTLHVLSDVYGPRLTGSPNHKMAAEWAVKQMTDWGFDNGHLEPWDFGPPGWLNERLTAHITAPVKDSLVCEVLAWTPSTKGVTRGAAYLLKPPATPTQAELDAFFAAEKANIRRRIVLVGTPQVVAVNLTPGPKRLEDKTLQERFAPGATPQPFGPPRPSPTPTPEGPKKLTPREVNEQVDKFLLENGALVRVNDAGREHGQIRAFNNRTFDVAKAVPTVVMRNEDYGRIGRLLADGREVRLEFNIVNRVYPEGSTSYNAVAEITGAEKPDEVLMAGGHLDSWHAATGATDNAIGCAIMMEAARLLKKSGYKPRRTIRVALWGGEEQGLLGSQAYVKKHFGSFENPTANYEKFGGYFNIDSGTGRIRGASVFGPPETAAIMREILEPFAEWGVAGALPSRSRGLGGSDNTSFNNAGLPGIGLFQDPIEYGTHTWHTNLDTYERIIEDDVKKAAVIVAVALYRLDQREQLLPRMSKEAMPAAPPAEDPIPRPAPRKGKK
jgi:hypothetical protein